MYISIISYPSCSRLYLLNFHLFFKMILILLYSYYMCVVLL